MVENPIFFYGTPNTFANPKYKKTKKWEIGFSNDFFDYNGGISSLDNKMKGKMWEALRKISKSPMTKVGNTIKPLKGNLKNLWRYRMGDYRIIYHPDTKYKNIVVLTVGHRKNIYKH